MKHKLSLHLNSSSNQVTYVHADKTIDIIELIIKSSDVLIATCELGEIFKHTRILAQLTSGLIENDGGLHDVAKKQSDPDEQVNTFECYKKNKQYH